MNFTLWILQMCKFWQITTGFIVKPEFIYQYNPQIKNKKKYMILWVQMCHQNKTSWQKENSSKISAHRVYRRVRYCIQPIKITVNILNIRTPKKICGNHSKIWTMWLYHRVMSPNNADRMANSVDPDQTAPLGAVWSGSALFAQAYLSKNLGSLWYEKWTIWWWGGI